MHHLCRLRQSTVLATRLYPVRQAQVRFFASHELSRMLQPLVRAPVNLKLVLACGRTPQAGCLMR